MNVLSHYQILILKILRKSSKLLMMEKKTLDKEELQNFMNECNFDIKNTDLIMKIADKSNHGYIDVNKILIFI